MTPEDEVLTVGIYAYWNQFYQYRYDSNQAVRKIDPQTGLIAMIAGSVPNSRNSPFKPTGDGELATSAFFGEIEKLAVDELGHIYVMAKGLGNNGRVWGGLFGGGSSINYFTVLKLWNPAHLVPQVTSASAMPSPVAGSVCTLSAQATHPIHPQKLLYRWATVGQTPAPVNFSANDSTAAKSTTASFGKAGRYEFEVTVADPLTFNEARHRVTVDVLQTPSRIAVTPARVSLVPGATQGFTAEVFDQFSFPMTVSPAVSWSANGGAISAVGLFTAGLATSQPGEVTASAGSVVGRAVAAITAGPNQLPTLTALPTATIAAAGGSAALSLGASDDGGTGNLIYTWTPADTNPGLATFSTNGTIEAREATVTFTRAGTYRFDLLVTDAGGLTASQSLTVEVPQVLTRVTLSPANGAAGLGTTVQFEAASLDQFDQPMSVQAPVAWSSSGVGSLDSSGRFQTYYLPGSAFVTATVGNKSAVTSIQVQAGAPRITQPATAALDPSGRYLELRVAAEEPLGEELLVYTWKNLTANPSGSGRVGITSNRSNQAKEARAVPWQAGTYVFQVEVSRPGGPSAFSQVTATIPARATTLDVAKLSETASALVSPGVPISATVLDQFGLPLNPPPPVTFEPPAEGTIQKMMSGDKPVWYYHAPGALQDPQTLRITTSAGFSRELKVHLRDSQLVASVAFQPLAMPPAPGSTALLDVGLPYGSKPSGFTYGWASENPNSGSASMDGLLTGYMEMAWPTNEWNFQLPNGLYAVRLWWYEDNTRDYWNGTLRVEGVVVQREMSVGFPKRQADLIVPVSDGNLTVSSADPDPAVRLRIAGVEIRRLDPRPSALEVAAGAPLLPASGTTDLSAVALDQFFQPLRPQPNVSWNVAAGGSLSTGGAGERFVAGAVAGGPYAVTAAVGSLTDGVDLQVGVPGVMQTLAGAGSKVRPDGPALTADLSNVTGVAVTPEGDLYVPCYDHERIWKVDHRTGRMAAVTVTGGWYGVSAPAAVDAVPHSYHGGWVLHPLLDAQENLMFSRFGWLWRINRLTDRMEQVAGNGSIGGGFNPVDGTPSTSIQIGPAFALDELDNIYLPHRGPEYGSPGKLLRVDAQSGLVTVLASGVDLSGGHIVADKAGSLYLVGQDPGKQVKRFDLATRTLSEVPEIASALPPNATVTALLVDPAGYLFVACGGTIVEFDPSNQFSWRVVAGRRESSSRASDGTDGDKFSCFHWGDGWPAKTAGFNQITSMTADATGNLYFLDADSLTPGRSKTPARIHKILGGRPKPAITSAAQASPNPVPGTTVRLSVGASDPGGEAVLTYLWTATGPGPVVFARNGTNAAKVTQATITVPGTYQFRVAARNPQDFAASSEVSVVASFGGTYVEVLPRTSTAASGQPLTFQATAYNALGQRLSPQPTWTWSVDGGGVIDAAGRFTAGPDQGGPFNVVASGAGATGNAQVWVSGRPVVASPAAASPNPVTGSTTSLSVLGASGLGEQNLTYTWTAAGPQAVAFSRNGSNAAKTVTATFRAPGTYRFLVTIADPNGATANSAVTVTVQPDAAAATLRVFPSDVELEPGGALAFSAVAYDRLGAMLSPQPAVTWSASAGGGITSDGVFTAGSAVGGPFTVTAAAGGVMAAATVRITQAPILTTVASASPAEVTGTTTNLSALASSAAGDAALVYAWTEEGLSPAPVSFSSNGTNAARNTVATFAKPGDYTLRVTVRDGLGRSAFSSVAVHVSASIAAVSLEPPEVDLATGAAQQFSVLVRDQFGDEFTPAPPITWSVDGGGTVAGGLFTAGATPGGPFLVTASAEEGSGSSLARGPASDAAAQLADAAQSSSPLAALLRSSDHRKVRVSDPMAEREVQAAGGRLVRDYGAFRLYVLPAHRTEALASGAPGGPKLDLEVEDDTIHLQSGGLRTTDAAFAARPLARAKGDKPVGKRLHLVHFAGPMLPAWGKALAEAGVQVVDYVPSNAYLVYGDAAALARVRASAKLADAIQWDGPMETDWKVAPSARAAVGASVATNAAPGRKPAPATELFSVQLVQDKEANVATLRWLRALPRAEIVRDDAFRQFRNLLVRLPAARAAEVAARADVVSIHLQRVPRQRDERQDQILAGNLNGAAPSGPGYLAWLAARGFTQAQFDLSGFVVDVTDSGIDNGTLAPNHFGLYAGGQRPGTSRLIYSRREGTPGPSAGRAVDGHGNLNAHILAGFDDAGGFPHADALGYRFGLGVAPFVRVGASVIFDPDYTYPDFPALQSRAYRDGARVSSNSWGADSDGAYDAQAQIFDALVRDAQPAGSPAAAAGNQEMVIVFAAGNSGQSSSRGTISTPASAKNVLTVGAAEGVRPFGGADGSGMGDAESDSADDIAPFSSRGPCRDGRAKPDLVAPGTHVTGGVWQSSSPAANGTADPAFLGNGVSGGVAPDHFFPAGQQFYTASSGTSHATPAVAGGAVLLRQHFLNQGWPAPSPAMTKAVLVNSARWLAGTSAGDTLPSPSQGMGMMNLGAALDASPRFRRDQLAADTFTATGQERAYSLLVADATKPLRVTLAWTDAPGSTTGAAYNNNLDLTVTVGGVTYKGNVFSGAFSVPGGLADPRNNVESVFLPAGTAGPVLVRVRATNLNSDGVPGNAEPTDQDFALVAANAVAGGASPVLSVVSSAVVSESFSPGNGRPDPGEQVAVSLELANIGTAPAANLTATLLPGGGVTAPGAAQAYGALAAGGATAARTFSFTVAPDAGAAVRASFQLSDGAADLGTVTATFATGQPRVTFATARVTITALAAAPAGLGVGRNAFGANVLTWSAVPGATQILVQRQNPDGTWTTIATLPGTATRYADATGWPGAWYRIAARGAGGMVSNYTARATEAAGSVPGTGAALNSKRTPLPTAGGDDAEFSPPRIIYGVVDLGAGRAARLNLREQVIIQNPDNSRTLWQAGNWTPLPFRANGLNDAGDLVGTKDFEPWPGQPYTQTHAVIARGGGAPEDLTPSEQPFWIPSRMNEPAGALGPYEGLVGSDVFHAANTVNNASQVGGFIRFTFHNNQPGYRPDAWFRFGGNLLFSAGLPAAWSAGTAGSWANLGNAYLHPPPPNPPSYAVGQLACGGAVAALNAGGASAGSFLVIDPPLSAAELAQEGAYFPYERMVERAFLCRDAAGYAAGFAPEALSTLGGSVSGATSLNDGGDVVGYSTLRAGDPAWRHQAVLWRSGTASRLAPLATGLADFPDGYAYANRITNAGVIGGSSITPEYYSAATLWTGGVARDLNASLPKLSRRILMSANDVSEAGAIAADGYLAGVAGPRACLAIPAQLAIAPALDEVNGQAVELSANSSITVSLKVSALGAGGALAPADGSVVTWTLTAENEQGRVLDPTRLATFSAPTSVVGGGQASVQLLTHGAANAKLYVFASVTRLARGGRAPQDFAVEDAPGLSTQFSCAPGQIVPLEEAAGPTNRKLALNGHPIADQKPQHEAETDEEKEESFVDALTLELRHSTTDIYVPVAGTELKLAARRALAPEIWSDRHGLRPGERPDRPFGVGWASNLTSNIHFVYQRPDAHRTETPANYAYVTDENGAQFRFAIVYGTGASAGQESYAALPGANHEQEGFLGTLTKAGTTYTFTHKHGSRLLFEDTGLVRRTFADRLTPLDQQRNPRWQEHRWARVTAQLDYFGSALDYTYAGTDTLIPSKIAARGRSGQAITITARDGLVTKLKDPSGAEQEFEYDVSPWAYGSFVTLRRVSGPAGPDGRRSRTEYGWDFAVEGDLSPGRFTCPTTHFHCDLGSLRDARGQGTALTRAWNRSRKVFDTAQGYYPATGLPRNVTAVALPDGAEASFENQSDIQLANAAEGGGLAIQGRRQTVATDAAGAKFTYEFLGNRLIELNDWRPYLAPGQRAGALSAPRLAAYTQLRISSPLGSQKFEYDLGAGFALKRATDLSGNVTQWEHTEAWTFPVPGFASADYPIRFFRDPTRQIDALGNAQSFAYEPTRRLLASHTDAEGRTTTYTIQNGKRTREVITGPGGGRDTAMEYASAQFPTFVTKRTVKGTNGGLDLVTEATPDALGRVQQQSVGGLVSTFTYDLNNRRLSETNPKPATTTFAYDARGHLVGVDYPATAAGAGSRRLEYDLAGNKVKETDELGVVTRFIYDPMNRLVEQRLEMRAGEGPDLVRTFAYNALGWMTSSTDAKGAASTKSYDALGRVVSSTDLNGAAAWMEYGPKSGGTLFESSASKPMRATDARGYQTEYEYDAMVRPTRQRAQYGGGTATSEFLYDKAGNLLQETDPLGRSTAHAYDALNRRISSLFADGKSRSTVYSAAGPTMSQTDELGRTTDFEYDAAGRQTKATGPAGSAGRPVTQKEHDGAGNVSATIDAMGARWEFAFDARNRKTGATGPAVLGGTPHQEWTYDAAGNLLTETDLRGNASTHRYDAAHRRIETKAPAVEVMQPDGSVTTAQPTTTYAHDGAGNVLSITDPNGNVTTNAFDGMNRLVSTSSAAGSMLRVLDPAGNLVEMTDGLGQKTTFTYDGLNRLLTSRDELGKGVTHAYDARNRLRTTDAEGRTVTFTYDLRHRLIGESRPEGTRTFSLDDAGRLTSVSDSTAAGAGVTYVLDGQDLLTSETSAGVTHTHTYDLAGRRLTSSQGGGRRSLSYAYDALGRLTSLQDGGLATTWKHDLDGHPLEKALPNGTKEVAVFDALGRRASLGTYTTAGNAPLITHAYRYDLAGNVRQSQEYFGSALPAQTVTLAYDAGNRLVQEVRAAAPVNGDAATTTSTFGYDAGNNRTSKGVTLTHSDGTPGSSVATTYAYNRLNQVTGYTDTTGRSVTFGYDGDGNRTSRTEGGLLTHTYAWNSDHRLSGVVKLAAGVNPSASYAYAYDHRARRIARTEPNAGNAPETTTVSFAGGLSVLETKAGAPTLDLVRGPDQGGGVGGLLYSQRTEAGTVQPLRLNHYSHRGDVTAQSDASGAMTWAGAYQAFGTRAAEWGANPERQRANTKEEDPTGLVNEGHRPRCLETGVFISKDPAGYVDGPNLYAFVRQNPWSSWDLEGLRDAKSFEELRRTMASPGAAVAGAAAAQAVTTSGFLPAIAPVAVTGLGAATYLGSIATASGGAGYIGIKRAANYAQFDNPYGPTLLVAAAVGPGLTPRPGPSGNYVIPKEATDQQVNEFYVDLKLSTGQAQNNLDDKVLGSTSARSRFIGTLIEGGMHRHTKKHAEFYDTESHHMITDDISVFDHYAAPAIRMARTDHYKTASHGGGALTTSFRHRQSLMIKAGDYDGALQMGVDDIRAKFGSKYDRHIQDMFDAFPKTGSGGIDWSQIPRQTPNK